MEEITVKTKEHLEVLDITSKVESGIKGFRDGLLMVYIPHTTAAVTIQEPDEELWKDLLDTYRELVPIRGDYAHNKKYSGMSGEQNAHAHILSGIIKPFILVPVENGQLSLGNWQSILFIELDGPRNRKVRLKFIPSK